MTNVATRRSKRKLQQLPSLHRQRKSSLQLQFERAIESPGGISKILHLVETATDHEIGELNSTQHSSSLSSSSSSGWTPLVGAIFRLGKNTTKNGNSIESERNLLQIINACHKRNISPNSGAWFGGHYHRPLVIAAYYGYSSAVKLLIELSGALVDLGDGEGRNVWFASFQNPVSSSSSSSSGARTPRLRKCDRRTAQVLLDAHVVTSDLGLWRRTLLAPNKVGSLCYANGDSSVGSVMLRALLNKNKDVVEFLCRAGGVITDRDYRVLRQRGQVNSRLLPMVMEQLLLLSNGPEETTPDNNNNTTSNRKKLMRSAISWSSRTDWSFPPTWKVGVTLCRNCGLPPDIFRSYVVPFLDRDWFYACFDDIRLPLLGPSLGERVGMNRENDWVETKTDASIESNIHS